MRNLFGWNVTSIPATDENTRESRFASVGKPVDPLPFSDEQLRQLFEINQLDYELLCYAQALRASRLAVLARDSADIDTLQQHIVEPAPAPVVPDLMPTAVPAVPKVQALKPLTQQQQQQVVGMPLQPSPVPDDAMPSLEPVMTLRCVTSATNKTQNSITYIGRIMDSKSTLCIFHGFKSQ